MSGQGEEPQKKSFNELLAKRDNALNIQEDHDVLHTKLSDSVVSLTDVFEAVKHLPPQISEQMNNMLENRSMLEYGKQLSIEALHDIEAAHDIKVQKQKLAIDAQYAEIDAKEIELNVVQKEFGYLQATLQQKQNKIAEMHEQIKAETCLLYEQRQVLSKCLLQKLTSKSDAKAKKSKFVEEQKARQAESTQMSNQIQLTQAENETIRQENSTMSDELAAIQAQCQSKLADLATLRSTVNDDEAKYTRAEEKNRKILSKIKTAERNGNAEIVRLESAISESSTAYENIKQTNDELTVEISAEIGDGESLEQKILQAENKLADLNIGCAELNNAIDVVNNSIAKANEPEARLPRKVQSKADPIRNKNLSTITKFRLPSENQVFKLPEKPLIDRANQMDGAQKGDHVFSRPLPEKTTKKSARKLKKRRRSFNQRQRSQVRVQALPIVQCADSSVSEWQTNSEVPEEDLHAAQKNFHTLELFKKYL